MNRDRDFVESSSAEFQECLDRQTDLQKRLGRLLGGSQGTTTVAVGTAKEGESNG